MLTGQLAVCAGSCGPGNMHLIQGLYDAQRNGAPVLAIASHIKSTEIGTGFFQETHPQELFRECSVYCELVSSPEQMPRMLKTAIATAMAKNGVAVLVVPGDISAEQAVHPTGKVTLPSGRSQLVPAPEQVQALAEPSTRPGP